MKIPLMALCLCMLSMGQGQALASESGESTGMGTAFRTVDLPHQMYPLLDDVPSFFLCRDVQDMRDIPFNYKGIVVAGTAEMMIESLLPNWADENGIDFTKHMLLVTFDGYGSIDTWTETVSIREHKNGVRVDVRKSNRESEGVDHKSVARVTLVPRHWGLTVFDDDKCVFRNDDMALKAKTTADDSTQ